MRWLAIALAVAGCGRIGFGAGSDGGATGDGRASDGPAVTGRHWVNRNDGTPGRLLSPMLAYDDARGTIVAYGGEDQDMGDTATAAMWELTAHGWQSLCDPCAAGPRYGGGFAYDPDRDRLVMVNGFDSTMFHAETWEWDGTSWKQIAAANGPPAGYLGHLTYDPRRHRMVMIGQLIGLTPDADIYEYDAQAWTHPQPSGGPGQAAGFGVEATFVPGAGAIYVLGDTGDTAPERDDLWSWDGASWTRICAACSGHARQDASLIYDPGMTTSWLVGGFGTTGEIDGTWQLVAGALQMTDSLPPRRDSVGLAYDRARDVIVMYGGNGLSCNGGAGGDCGETWEYTPD